MRNVKNTSGEPEERLVIETALVLNRRRWRIEVTLADRTNMTLPLILGRTALRRHRVLVDPGKSHLLRRQAGQKGKNQMKIAMLAQNHTLYSHKRLKEAAEARGHELDMIKTLRCYMNIASRRPEIYYNGEKLPSYDAVIPRIGASVTFYGTGRAAPVRDAGRLPAQRKCRHRPLARQAALDAASGARRHRPAGHHLRP